MKIEFEVSDIRTTYERLREHEEPYDWVRSPPADMPWDTRIVVLRDSDDHLVELYEPLGDQGQ